MADFQYSVSDYSAAGETSLEESSTGALSGVDSPKTGSPEDSEGSKAESEDPEGSKEGLVVQIVANRRIAGFSAHGTVSAVGAGNKAQSHYCRQCNY